MYIYLGLHPLSALLGRLGLASPSDVDLTMLVLTTWILGSRENELVKKPGFVVAVAVLEAVVLVS